ncbi:hypothetical protein Tco_0810122 [Tanacetum coccineum]
MLEINLMEEDTMEHPRSMTNFRGTTIVPSSSYKVGGSSRAMQEHDDDDDSTSEQRVHTDGNMGSEED